MYILLPAVVFLLSTLCYLLKGQRRQAAMISLLQERLEREQQRSINYYKEIRESESIQEVFYEQYCRREKGLRKKNAFYRYLLCTMYLPRAKPKAVRRK